MCSTKKFVPVSQPGSRTQKRIAFVVNVHSRAFQWALQHDPNISLGPQFQNILDFTHNGLENGPGERRIKVRNGDIRRDFVRRHVSGYDIHFLAFEATAVSFDVTASDSV
jgi:hypothetical protein